MQIAATLVRGSPLGPIENALDVRRLNRPLLEESLEQAGDSLRQIGVLIRSVVDQDKKEAKQ
jgi:hypothetical protein